MERKAARLLLFTGDGKGKTTAALGLALRALGHDKRVSVLQFVKSDASTGEREAFARFPEVEFAQLGLGFLPKPSSSQFAKHRKAAETGLALARERIAECEEGVIILDEICFAVARGLLAEEQVIDTIKQAPANSIIVLTGRGATEGLTALADTVTEMRCIKHALQAGVPAQIGVER